MFFSVEKGLLLFNYYVVYDVFLLVSKDVFDGLLLCEEIYDVFFVFVKVKFFDLVCILLVLVVFFLDFLLVEDVYDVLFLVFDFYDVFFGLWWFGLGILYDVFCEWVFFFEVVDGGVVDSGVYVVFFLVECEVLVEGKCLLVFSIGSICSS